MATVAVSVVRPGLVLQRPVYTPRGVLLAPEGTELTEAHLATFMSSGVAEIDIVGEEEAPKRAIDPAKMEMIARLLDQRFALVEAVNNPFLRDVRAAAEEIMIDRVRALEESERG